MFEAIAKRVFGSANERFLNGLSHDVDAINALEPSLEALGDEELRARTPWLKQRLADGEKLDDLLVDAFATVREAAKRTLGQRPFDVQLLGGIVLHQGRIAEMATGEGKTLVSTLPVYLNALRGKGVHIITVNDYLAKRDAAWMGAIYEFLGMTVGCITHGLDDDARRRDVAVRLNGTTGRLRGGNERIPNGGAAGVEDDVVGAGRGRPHGDGGEAVGSAGGRVGHRPVVVFDKMVSEAYKVVASTAVVGAHLRRRLAPVRRRRVGVQIAAEPFARLPEWQRFHGQLLSPGGGGEKV